MNKKYIYTIGYTLFQKGNTIDLDGLFKTLCKLKVDFLIDVRSIPFSKQYRECNADNMKIAGKKFDLPYMSIPELGAKASCEQDVFQKPLTSFLKKKSFPLLKAIDQKRPSYWLLMK